MSTSSNPEVEAKLEVPFAIISDFPYKIWQTINRHLGRCFKRDTDVYQIPNIMKNKNKLLGGF